MREMMVKIHKLSMMKKLVKTMDEGVRIVNLYHLLVQNFTTINVFDLYNAVKNLFAFPSLNKRRHLKIIDWNNYYNILCARKVYLVGDIAPKN